MSAYRKTLEELGAMMSVTLEVEIDYDVYPTELPSFDFPGTPGFVDLTGVSVLRFQSETVDRTQFGDWRDDLDAVAYRWVEKHWDDITDEIGEIERDAADAAREDQWEAIRDGRLDDLNKSLGVTR